MILKKKTAEQRQVLAGFGMKNVTSEAGVTAQMYGIFSDLIISATVPLYSRWRHYQNLTFLQNLNIGSKGHRF